MPTGAITGYIDVAQLVLYAFWIFFAGLIFYLRREDKREGYPLVAERPDTAPYLNFPPIPSPKVFRLADGQTVSVPTGVGDTRTINAQPVAAWPGAPLNPIGNPMADGVGPASYAERAEKPDITVEGEPRIVPLRGAVGFSIEPRDPDPRGMIVIGADRGIAGTVRDVWVDRSEIIIRYLEVEFSDNDAAPRSVLLPINFAKIDGRRRRVDVNAILSGQFAGVPRLANPEQVTLREEDRITAYYGGGMLYATPTRTESVL
jgi:photosynthetic reaction center H subunit